MAVGYALMYAPGMTRRASGLGDFVCPDFPDFSTCYDSSVSQAPAPYVAGAGPLAVGQTRVLPVSASAASTQTVSWINQNAVTILIVSAALFLALGVSRR